MTRCEQNKQKLLRVLENTLDLLLHVETPYPDAPGEGYREDEPIIKRLRHLIAQIKEKQ